MNKNSIQVLWLNAPSRKFRLESITVDPLANTLQGPDGEYHVGPRAMDVFAYLAHRGGAVVTREELHEQVWHGRVVVDEALSRCISELRQAVSGCGGSPGLIRTVRGRGYQLNGALLYLDDPDPDLQPPHPAASSNATGTLFRWAAVPALALLMLAGAFSWHTLSGNRALQRGELPLLSLQGLENLTGSDQRELFARALTLELEARLANASDMIMVTAEEADEPSTAGIGIPFLSPRQTADYVLSGSLSPASRGSVRLSLSLRHRDGTLQGGTVITLAPGADREHAMSQVVNQVRGTLGLPPLETAGCRWSGDSEAMEKYFLGRRAVQARGETSIRNGIELLKEALVLDPGFGQAMATLSLAYELMPHYIAANDPDAEASASALYPPLSRATAEKALQTCDSLGEAWYVLRESPDYEGDNPWLRNRYSVEYAVALEPNNDDLRRFYAEHLQMAGKLREAGEQYERAYRINPANARTLQQYALYLAAIGDHERALELDSQSGAVSGHRAPYVRTSVSLGSGDWEAARTLVLAGENGSPQVINTAMMDVINALEQPAHLQDARESVRQVYRTGFPGGINFLVTFGSLLGDLDYIFQALEEGAEQPWMPAIWSSETRALRADDRINELFASQALFEYWQAHGPPDACQWAGDRLRCNG